MLVKKLKHTDWRMLAIPDDCKKKIEKLSQDTGYTQRSIVETAIEVLLSIWPVESKLVYSKSQAKASLRLHKKHMRKFPTLKDKRITKNAKNKVKG